MKELLLIAGLAIGMMSCTGPSQTTSSQDGGLDKETKVRELITSGNYVFRAQMANPLRGRNFQLTSEYDVRVSKDSIVCWLPYFGRAFSAPMSPTQGGIQFTSTKFEYKLTEKKRGWDVFIRPSDVNTGDQLSMNITTSGYATLQAISNNRQSISFTGFIEERKPG